jgi:hypothetical protein
MAHELHEFPRIKKKEKIRVIRVIRGLNLKYWPEGRFIGKQ